MAIQSELFTQTEQPDLAFLAGPARSGKNSIEAAYDMAAATLIGQTIILRTDDIRNELWEDPILRRIAANDRDSLEGDLFAKQFDDGRFPSDLLWRNYVLNQRCSNGRSYLSDRQRRQSEAMLRISDMDHITAATMAEAFVGRVLVQGIALLPEYLAGMREKYPKSRPLAVVNTDPHYVETTLDIVRRARIENPGSNWMCAKTDAWVRDFMTLNVSEIGHEWKQDCRDRDVPCLEMGFGQFADKIVAAVDYLAYGTPLMSF